MKYIGLSGEVKRSGIENLSYLPCLPQILCVWGGTLYML